MKRPAKMLTMLMVLSIVMAMTVSTAFCGTCISCGNSYTGTLRSHLSSSCCYGSTSAGSGSTNYTTDYSTLGGSEPITSVSGDSSLINGTTGLGTERNFYYTTIINVNSRYNNWGPAITQKTGCIYLYWVDPRTMWAGLHARDTYAGMTNEYSIELQNVIDANLMNGKQVAGITQITSRTGDLESIDLNESTNTLQIVLKGSASAAHAGHILFASYYPYSVYNSTLYSSNASSISYFSSLRVYCYFNFGSSTTSVTSTGSTSSRSSSYCKYSTLFSSTGSQAPVSTSTTVINPNVTINVATVINLPNLGGDSNWGWNGEVGGTYGVFIEGKNVTPPTNPVTTSPDIDPGSGYGGGNDPNNPDSWNPETGDPSALASLFALSAASLASIKFLRKKLKSE